ncbi:MAG: DUF3800 domain-containing protein [Bacteroidota bacterium]
MTFYLFLDESGDHGLGNIDLQFPVFVLCGVLISESSYKIIENNLNEIKRNFWGDKKVIIHSSDIRKCEKEFQILFDLELKKNFYKAINNLITNSDYTIIAAAINKQKYIHKYGKLSDDVYEISLSFLIERSIFYLDNIHNLDKQLKIIIEKRGRKEDKKLDDHFQKLCAKGTGFVDASRLKNYNIEITFCNKQDDLAGLQLADLLAYPIARHTIDPNRANPAFDIFANKFYIKDKKRYGLKIFP